MFNKLPVTFNKQWIWFFAILQIGGLLSAFVQTGLIIYMIRKSKKELMEGGYY